MNGVSFICLTETWLTRAITDPEVQIKGYKLFRSDRISNNTYPHGGVATYIKDNISVDSHKFSNGSVEVIVCHLKEIGTTLVTLYRPPSSGATQLKESLDFVSNHITNLPTSDIIIITGDFNFPPSTVLWKSCPDMPYGLVPMQTQTSPSFDVLYDFMQQYYLVQHVNSPTRMNNVLDLVLTNSDCIHKISVQPTILSDHNLINIESNIPLKGVQSVDLKKRSGLSKFKFKTTDWPNIRSKISELDLRDLIFPDIDYTVNLITETLEKICTELNIEKFKDKPRLIFIPNERKRMFRQMSKLKKRLTRLNSPIAHKSINQRLLTLSIEVKSSIQRDTLSHECLVASKVKSNPKAFYSYANTKRKVPSKIGPFCINNTTIADNREMAEELRLQFEKVYTKPSNAPQQDKDPLPKPANILTEFVISETDIREAISSSKGSSSPGPDGIPPFFLKECATELTPILKELAQLSFKNGFFPTPLKETIVTPIFKSGDPSKPSNYRPISLVSCLGKILERVVQQQILAHAMELSLIPPNQHGFRPGHSTTSELLEHIHDIIVMLEEQETVEIVLLDFSKAFDKVSHNHLLQRLHSFGIQGRALSWIESFLTNRTQKVCVNGELSDKFKVLSGVPQGTVTGPLLFILYLAPLLTLPLSSQISSFADDTKLKHSSKIYAKSDLLEADLQNVYQWCRENEMELNSNKFNILRMSSSPSAPNWTYNSSSGEPIKTVDLVRDLGVQIEGNGTFNNHIETTITKANMTAGWILRTFVTRDADVMLQLFKSLVLPILDYASPVWFPTHTTLITKLEKVQRGFTRKIKDLESLSYWDRLKKLQLFSTERRSERYLLIYMFKIVHNLVPNPGVKFHLNDRQGYTCHPRRISPFDSKILKTLKRDSFEIKGGRIFNLLPHTLRQPYHPDTKNAVEKFKNELDKFLWTIPDQPKVQGLGRPANSNSLIDQIYYKIV